MRWCDSLRQPAWSGCRWRLRRYWCAAVWLLPVIACAVEFKVTAVSANIPESFPFPDRFCISREWGGEELTAVEDGVAFADANKAGLAIAISA